MKLIIEYRYGRSQDHLPALAAELVALSPDLLIAANRQSAVALKSTTANIPIVFVGVADPVRIGLVQSLSRPGGNIAGLATFVPGNFVGKMIETLREMVPTASKIAILVNPSNPIHRLTVAAELELAEQIFQAFLSKCQPAPGRPSLRLDPSKIVTRQIIRTRHELHQGIAKKCRSRS